MNIGGALQMAEEDDDDSALANGARRRGSVLQRMWTAGSPSTCRRRRRPSQRIRTVAVDDRNVRRPENAPAKSIEERLKLRIAGLSGTIREVTAEKHLVEQERDALRGD